MSWLKDAWLGLKVVAAVNTVVAALWALGVDHVESVMMAIFVSIIIPATLALIGVGVITARLLGRAVARVCRTLAWEASGLVNRATV